MVMNLNEFKIDRNTPFDQIPDEWVKDIEVPEAFLKETKTPLIIIQKAMFINREMGEDTTHPIKIREATEEDFEYIGDEPKTPEERAELSREYAETFLGVRHNDN